jgi:outer membrane receptor for ferrienterochelin and colicins
LPAKDTYLTTNPFADVSVRLAYSFTSSHLDTDLELFAGVKNILNSYQRDFDTGKNRDSNFIYGPSAPRTFYIGLKIKSL